MKTLVNCANWFSDAFCLAFYVTVGRLVCDQPFSARHSCERNHPMDGEDSALDRVGSVPRRILTHLPPGMEISTGCRLQESLIVVVLRTQFEDVPLEVFRDIPVHGVQQATQFAQEVPVSDLKWIAQEWFDIDGREDEPQLVELALIVMNKPHNGLPRLNRVVIRPLQPVAA